MVLKVHVLHYVGVIKILSNHKLFQEWAHQLLGSLFVLKGGLAFVDELSSGTIYFADEYFALGSSMKSLKVCYVKGF